MHRSSLATSRYQSLLSPLAYFLYRDRRSIGRRAHSKRVGCTYEIVRVVSLKRSPVRKRPGGEKEIYRGCGPRTALSGTLFYANRLSFFLVSRRALSRRSAPRRGVNSYATRCLHYHISDAICSPGINAPEVFRTSAGSRPSEKRIA